MSITKVNQIKDEQTHPPTSKASNRRGLHSGKQYKLQDGSKRHPPGGPIPGMCSSRVSAGHNIHELYNCYQQGRTMTVTFSQLARYCHSSRVDQTGLGHWPWIQIRTGEHWTQIVSAYQPCCLSGQQLIGHNGLMKVGER
jgi:hypothetical protein